MLKNHVANDAYTYNQTYDLFMQMVSKQSSEDKCNFECLIFGYMGDFRVQQYEVIYL